MEYSNPNDEPYFFGRLLRKEAEYILNKFGKQDGLFLLREKPQESGNYVLSMCFQENFQHYKISRLKNHNVKLQNGREFIGPVELINHHRTHLDGLKTKPTIECSRHQYMIPIYYLFLDSTNLKNSIKARIGRECKNRNEETNALGRDFYIHESRVLQDYHLNQTWFRNNLDSESVRELFTEDGLVDGKFVLRRTRVHFTLRYKLHVCYQNNVHQHNILLDKGKFFIEKDRDDTEKQFEFITQLIDYYGREKGSLEHKLVVPLGMNHDTYDSNTQYDLLFNDNVPIVEPYIKFIARISHSQVSNVYHATYNGKDVAVKLLKYYNDECTDESGILKQLLHPHIINVINVETNVNIYKKINPRGRIVNNLHQEPIRLCTGFNQENLKLIAQQMNNDYVEVRRFSYTIMEYSLIGMLTMYLRRNAGEIQNLKIFHYTRQILNALEYLTSKNIIHRSVQARNVLLFENDVAKLGGFGLARRSNDTPNLRGRMKCMLPSRWYPPEAFEGTYSEKTDVWSFGVLLWETFSRGETPFSHHILEDNLLNEELRQGRLLLDRPASCPESMYDLMRSCWTVNPNERPNFKTVSARFNEAYGDYITLDTQM